MHELGKSAGDVPSEGFRPPSEVHQPFFPPVDSAPAFRRRDDVVPLEPFPEVLPLAAADNPGQPPAEGPSAERNPSINPNNEGHPTTRQSDAVQYTPNEESNNESGAEPYSDIRRSPEEIARRTAEAAELRLSSHPYRPSEEVKLDDLKRYYNTVARQNHVDRGWFNLEAGLAASDPSTAYRYFTAAEAALERAKRAYGSQPAGSDTAIVQPNPKRWHEAAQASAALPAFEDRQQSGAVTAESAKTVYTSLVRDVLPELTSMGDIYETIFCALGARQAADGDVERFMYPTGPRQNRSILHSPQGGVFNHDTEQVRGQVVVPVEIKASASTTVAASHYESHVIRAPGYELLGPAILGDRYVGGRQSTIQPFVVELAHTIIALMTEEVADPHIRHAALNAAASATWEYIDREYRARIPPAEQMISQRIAERRQIVGLSTDAERKEPAGHPEAPPLVRVDHPFKKLPLELLNTTHPYHLAERIPPDDIVQLYEAMPLALRGIDWSAWQSTETSLATGNAAHLDNARRLAEYYLLHYPPLVPGESRPDGQSAQFTNDIHELRWLSIALLNAYLPSLYARLNDEQISQETARTLYEELGMGVLPALDKPSFLADVLVSALSARTIALGGDPNSLVYIVSPREGSNIVKSSTDKHYSHNAYQRNEGVKVPLKVRARYNNKDPAGRYDESIRYIPVTEIVGNTVLGTDLPIPQLRQQMRHVLHTLRTMVREEVQSGERNPQLDAIAQVLMDYIATPSPPTPRRDT